MNENFFWRDTTFTKALLMAVNNIVSAIKNSVRLLFKLMMLNVLNINVVQWPMVNAVTSTSIFL